MKRLIILICAIITMAGCSKNNDLGQKGGEQAVKFSAEALATRLSDDGSMWSKGDEINVFMATADDGSMLYNDVKYVATQDNSAKSSFELVEGQLPICYSAGKDVEFYAFYSKHSLYHSAFDAVVSDISDQSNFDAIDLMIADAVTVNWEDGANVGKSVDFNFKHRLAKVVFNVTCNETVKDIEGLSGYFTDIVDMALYKITGENHGEDSGNAECTSFNETQKLDIENITLTGVNDWNSHNAATVVALVHPCVVEDTKLYLKSYNEEFVFDFTPTNLKGGYAYSYDVVLGRDGVQFDENSYKLIDWDSAGESKDVDSNLQIDGLGTAENPYIITSASEMAKIGVEYPLDGCYKLYKDIDLGDVSWNPIGSESEPFVGVFDGGGYSIKGLNLARNSCRLALFGVVGSEGVVKNISVYGRVGSPSSNGETDYIDYVNYIQNVAGIVGLNSGNVINCHNYADVLVGFYNVYADRRSAVTGIAGVVGRNNGGTIAYCSNSGKIDVSGKHAQNGYTGSVAGVVGSVYSNSVIVNCWNSGEVYTADQGGEIGGVCGYIRDVSVVANCYNSGEITGNDTVGGLVGMDWNGCSYYGCYNVGAVNASYNPYSNGFYGMQNGGMFTECYTSNFTTGYQEIEDDEVESVDADLFDNYLKDILNSGVKLYNATSPEIEASSWSNGSGDYTYPVLDLTNANSY